MYLTRFIPLINYLTGNKSRRDLLRLLQKQRQLLRAGMEGQAEVIHTVPFNRYIGSLQQVQLWLKLKKADGSYIYTHSDTLVNSKKMPHSGNTIRIRYVSEKPGVVHIL